ncbi:beta-N-acetylhexosaminidase [Roseivirga sp. BDSF3-8]|uniref:beta-N-acetylhexosaminidase n=1 Tax=Roseivirga sp. BDSF3-8 TaxID=3241598 RepID=UPI0035323E4B
MHLRIYPPLAVCLLAFLISSFTIPATKEGRAPVTVIPEPVSITTYSGSLSMDHTWGIYTKDEEIETDQVATYLQGLLQPATGYEWPLARGNKKEGIHLRLYGQRNEEIGEEGYRLQVTNDGVYIRANTPKGLFYGVQTLMQLLPPEIDSQEVTTINWTLPYVDITDYPRFGWRGIMLDVSRHFYTKEEVKQLISQMARYKYNRFHWHLTDDQGWRVQIEGLPGLTETGAWRVERYGKFGERKPPQAGEPTPYGGYYTPQDIQEVIAYASKHHIEVMPEIDVPGHSMAAIASYPELSVTDSPAYVNPGSKFVNWLGGGKFEMFVDNTLDPTDEATYLFLDKVFGEIARLFPFEYIHMGGDEAYHGYWERDSAVQAFMEAHDLQDGEALQSYFVGRVNNIINSKGKKMIGWDEIMDGGLADGAAVMSWRGTKAGVEASQQGVNVVMSPWPMAYLDLYQGDRAVEPPTYSRARLQDIYSWDPVPEGADPAYILGGQGNIWTEHIPYLSQVHYMAFPRVLALSEVLWSPRQERDWQELIPKIEEEFQRLEKAGINYSRSMYDPIIKVTRQETGERIVELETEIDGLDIYYTIDGTIPGRYASRYQQPITLPEGVDQFRVITYRNGEPIGKLISLDEQELNRRAR